MICCYTHHAHGSYQHFGRMFLSSIPAIASRSRWCIIFYTHFMFYQYWANTYYMACFIISTCLPYPTTNTQAIEQTEIKDNEIHSINKWQPLIDTILKGWSNILYVWWRINEVHVPVCTCIYVMLSCTYICIYTSINEG